MESKKILVACSELDILLIDKILRTGYLLEYVNSQEDILSKCEEKEYDLLLIDVCFLKPTLGIIPTLRKKGRKIVGLSSEPMDARDKKIKNAGCDACYIKPFQPDSFSMFIKYWCE